MWHEKFINKHGETKYRYYEKYKDPLTNKWRRVSVVLNKNGKQSQKEAQKLLNKRIEEKLNDKTPTTLKSLTFHAACDEWLEYYKNHSGSKATTIKEKLSNTNTVKNAIDKEVLINNITHTYLQDIINEWAKLHSKGHVQSLVTIIRSVFKYAFKYYDLQDISVLDKIDIPKKAKTRDELQAKRNNYLEDSEVKELLSCFDYLIKHKNHSSRKRNYNMVKAIVQFQIANGMRIGELLAIKSDNINYEDKTLDIDGTINWVTDKETGAFGVKETTKTSKSYRTIGLTTQSINLLKTLILENKKENQWNEEFIDRGYVFTNTAGSPIDLNKINSIIKEAAEISSIKKRVTTHTLRHTHISTLAQLGINLKAIQERVGHSDYKTTLEIYTHVTDQMAKDMMNKLETINIV
ncbi:tyrosine-type recombinase/integrase [Staphylococcus epidermidis]|uniref:tyrosine-type recombinase/integrase n=1 Tax=Staphylococcus epidermidis TaxID=1282 RepID=UPI00024E1ED6|nr:site-specific integrase [Staphylococcus epidermidis]DAO39309.1 MAG TPA: SITE SPECIFIC RECOMBINASE XERD [Caudoviricetes sp.]EHR80139.1 site-specific recombinase, phage integrase family [Staphylococcus epidermidis VCU120]EJE27189.1 pathogenicity island protein, integrase [Staphylococcus epidermidis NIH05005]EJE36462.1 pathogenicity island protein, integrase [Staphylococcus epidermidis NIH05001]EZI11806.1 site-specific recombinase, phage integrase family [Staphylococcus epidermidis VCU014]